MTIEGVKNYDVVRHPVMRQASQPLRTGYQQQSFGAGYSARKGLTDNVSELMNNRSKWIGRFIESGGKGAGEILNTLATAFGTAIVAPIFIRYNPIAKEDEETRAYSAWRQPISAVIAVIFQVATNLGFNRLIDTAASSGKWTNIDLSAKPQDSYLKAQIKKEGLNLSKKELGKEIERRQFNAFNEAVEKVGGKFRDVAPDYAELISPEEYKDVKKAFESKDEHKRFMEEIDKLPKKERAKRLDAAIKEKAIKSVKQRLHETVRGKEFILNMMSKDSGFFDTASLELRTAMNRINNGNIDFKAGDFRILSGAVQDKLAAFINRKITVDDFKKFLSKTLEMLEVAKSDVKQGDIGSLKGKNFAELLRNEEVREFVKNGIRRAEARFSQFKKSYGMLISLLTLPFSCGLLNWSYPRIMEIIMPEVAQAKKDKQALVANNMEGARK